VSEYDSPWKEALDVYFEQFLAFFFPPVHRDVDWSRGYEILDKELQQVVREAEQGRRVVDKLVKVWRKDGQEEWVLIHVEVQSQEEADFARRMFVYNYRIFDRYNRAVASFAVLGDERSNWRPNHFRYNLWGCSVGIEFPVVKLVDCADKVAVLEADANPFAAVVLAHLKTQETRKDPLSRMDWKTRIVKGLHERGWSAKDVRLLWRFIDWMMDLPKALEDQVGQAIEQYEKEKQMPFIDSATRRGMEKGLEQGLREGKQEGLREGLLSGIELALELKFPEGGLQLMPEIRQITDVEVLGKVHRAIRTATAPDELRQVWS
jgi:hypothetical protein